MATPSTTDLTSAYKSRMQWPRFRPTFSMPLSIPPDALVAGFREQLTRPGAPVTGMVFSDQIELRILEKDQQLFTPVLHLLIKTDVLLLGRFAPHPHLWMLIIAIYFALAFVGIGGIVVAMSLALVMKSSVPWALWLVAPAALAVGGFIHGAVLIGQGLSAVQMHVLRSFLEHVIDEKTNAIAQREEPALLRSVAR